MWKSKTGGSEIQNVLEVLVRVPDSFVMGGHQVLVKLEDIRRRSDFVQLN